MRNVLPTLALTLGTLFLIGGPATAAVFNATNVTELQAHLTTAATNGQDDTINVAAGTYNVGTTLFHGGLEAFSLTIAGAGADATFLDGGNAVKIMQLFPNGDLTVSGLTFRNADGAGGPPGAGLEVQGFQNGTTTTISDCIFQNNKNSPSGGGAEIMDDMIIITNSTFSGNAPAANQGPGGGANITGNTSVAISNSTFMNNGDAGTPVGGGLFLNAGTITITDSTFSGNTVAPDGQGGGMWMSGGALTITGSTFDSNSTDTTCGGAPGGSGAGALISAGLTLIISENTFSNNGVPCGPFPGGGGLHVEQGGDEIRIVNNFFFDNVSGAGVAPSSGAISFASTSNAVNVTNNTFSGNDSGDATADILVIVDDDQASANIYNNIFWGGPGDDLLEVRDAAATPVRIFNNDLDINSVTLTNGNDYVQSGNLNINPLFVDEVNGDLHLTELSPVIGMGLNTAPAIPALDFDGDTRILDGTVDMGADEFTLPPPTPTNPAIFNSGTGILDIPEVLLDGTAMMAEAGTKAYQVKLQRLNEPGYAFQLMAGAKKITPTGVPSATFKTKTGVLDIPVVQIQGSAKTYNVQMLKRAGEFIFDMTKAKKN